MDTLKIDTFQRRLRKIGVDVEFSVNFPWIYMVSVNGNHINIEDRYMSNYKFTAFILAQNDEIVFLNRRKTFSIVRKYLNKNI